MFIRHAEVTDAKQIIDYCNLVSGQSDNLAFGLNQFGISQEAEERYIHSLQGKDNGMMLVVIDKQNIIGLATIGGPGRLRLKHNVEIGLSVHKDYWNQGIGFMLVETIISECENTGFIKNITLTVREDNINALKLYAKCGFKQAGKYTNMINIDETYYNGIIMEYTIE